MSFSTIPKGLPEIGRQYRSVLLFNAQMLQPTCFPTKGEDLYYGLSLLKAVGFKVLAGLVHNRRLD